MQTDSGLQRIQDRSEPVNARSSLDENRLETALKTALKTALLRIETDVRKPHGYGETGRTSATSATSVKIG
jgi:hypothetical protein